MDLTLVEIIDWCIYGLEEGNPEGVPPLLNDLKKAVQVLDDQTCPLCGTGHIELTRFSGLEIEEDFPRKKEPYESNNKITIR